MFEKIRGYFLIARLTIYHITLSKTITLIESLIV